MKRPDQILKGVDYEKVTGCSDVRIANLEQDSRKVVTGSMFFAIRGTESDGHDYIDSAIKAGAVAVVCESIPVKKADDICYIKVSDSARVLGLAASAFYDHPSEKLRLVGITGTNGKTTTATLLYRLFKETGHKAGLISTVSYFINEKKLPATHTTPDQVHLNRLLNEMVEDGCEYCFMEVSSHSIVQHRISGLKFAGGVFTNLSHDHLDYHKTYDEYLKAKKRFFDNLEKESFALVNFDDRNGKVMVQNTKASVRSYAMKSMADFRGSIVERHMGGMLLKMNGKELWTSFIGNFNASNLLAVYATALMLGSDEEEVLRIISSLKPVEGRFETILSGNGVTAIVDYAHTPDALENVIEAIRPLLGTGAKLITVAGAGGDRDTGKRPVMAKIASEKSDKLILTSDNPRSEDPDSIISDMLAGVGNLFKNRVICISNRKEAIRTACMMAQTGDFVLVAGKGHETYQEVRGVRHHFDDREVVISVFNVNRQVR